MPEPSARTRESLDTHQRILTGAEEVFAELGYHEASMDKVVRRSGVSKGAIYFHFVSKEALFFALVDRLADSLARSIQEAVAGRQGAVTKVDAALQRVFSTLARHRRLARILLARGVGLGPTLDKRLMAAPQRFATIRLLRRGSERATYNQALRRTAQLHLQFGLLLAAGLVGSRLLQG